jgi:hypothetical protein
MILAITIEHAVTKPMVRLGGEDFTEARWVSLFIRRKSYSTFLRQNGMPISNKESESGDPMLGVRSSISSSLRDDFPKLSETLPSITLQAMNAHSKLSVEMATQLTVFLANRPGALARVCEALANAGITFRR